MRPAIDRSQADCTNELKFGRLFHQRFMDINVSIPVIEALDLAWKTLAECFDPAELLMKQTLVDKYFPKKALTEQENTAA